MSKQEKVVCAAIKIEWFDGYRKRSTEFLGIDYKIIRNDEVYEMFFDDYKFLSEVMGFITNKNRFVDPKEAMKIAIDADQIEDIKGKLEDFRTKFDDFVDLYSTAYPKEDGSEYSLSDFTNNQTLQRIRLLEADPRSKKDHLLPGDLY